MTDHAEEQAMELEALEAILADDMEEWDEGNPPGWGGNGTTWAINIRPSLEGGEEPEEEPQLGMQLLFSHTLRYPDEPPALRLRSVRGLSDADLAEAMAGLQAHMQESMGMAMIYTLVTAAQEWLGARVAAGPAGTSGLDPDAEAKRRREEEEAARTAARAHGHPVTVEAFKAWKAAYEAEQAAAKAAGESGGGGNSKGGGGGEARLSGKAWFLQQISAGKVESGSEEPEDDGEGEGGEEEDEFEGDEDEDDEEFDPDEEDDEDDDMLDEYLAAKASGGGS